MGLYCESQNNRLGYLLRESAHARDSRGRLAEASAGGESMGESANISSDQPETQNNEIFTVFNSLKAPKLSDLTRKWKVDSNPPPKGKRRARGEGANEPKTVTASQRVKEFPGESLATAGKGGAKLFCTACREELSLKKRDCQSWYRSVTMLQYNNC